MISRQFLALSLACLASFASPTSRAAGIYKMSGTLSNAQATVILAPYGSSIGLVKVGTASLVLTGVTLFDAGSTLGKIGTIGLSDGQLSPAFSPSIFSYTTKVRASTSSISVKPTLAPAWLGSYGVSVDCNSINGQYVNSGSDSGPLALSHGTNVIKVTVSPLFMLNSLNWVPDIQTYTITVIRPEIDTPEIGVKVVGAGLNEEIQNKTSRSIGRTLLGASTDVSFTISNTDYGDLTGVAASISGPNASDFLIVTAPAATVAGPTGSTASLVRFAPKAKGKKSATVRIASNDADENPFEVTLTAIAGDQPEILSPADGVILNAGATGFAWDTGASGATIYALSFGSAPGLADRGFGWFASTTTSTTVTSPGDGDPVFVTLSALVNGVWKTSPANYTDYRSATKVRLLSPTNGSTLTGPTLDLQWDAGVGVTSTALWVGTMPGGYDLYAANEGTRTSRSLPIPADRKIYVTLWSLISGVYQPVYYAFNAYPSSKAEVSSPANGSTLAAGTLSLAWTSGIGVSRYAIWIGSSPSLYDIAAADMGTATSRTFTVPRDGGPIYVTLYSLINGVWQSQASWFTTAQPAVGSRPAALTSPAANTSTLPGSRVDLAWDAGVGASQYALWVGSRPDGYEIYARLEGAGRSRSVTLPTGVSRAYVTLFSLVGAAWQSNAYWFDVPPGQTTGGGATSSVASKAVINAPTAGSVLTAASQTFAWSSAGNGVAYALWVGRKPGGYELYAAYEGASLSKTLSLPADGTPVYVTLWSLVNGRWQSSESFCQAVFVP